MANAEKKYISYAQVFLDFANAATSDEACLKLFDNMQKAFNHLSAKFGVKAKKGFPSLNRFELSLNKPKRALSELILKEQRSINFLNGQFEMTNKKIDDYNWQEQTLIFRCYYYGGALSKGEFGVAVDVELTEEHIDDLKVEIERELKPETFDEVKNLMEIGKKISEFKKSNSISEPEYCKIKKLSENYADLLHMHSHINNTSTEIKELLEQIANRKSLSESKTFQHILEIYNSNISPKLLLQKDNTIARQSFFNMFSEDDFIQQLDTKNFLKISSLTHLYKLLLIYCIVEFFVIEGKNKLIHICQECNNFYISKTIRPSMFCSDKCRLTFHNRKRIQSGEAKKYKQKKRRDGAKESYYG